MSKKEKRALESHLQNLMMHILKWKNQIQKRTLSWTKTIDNSRKKITKIQEENPSLNDDYLKSIFVESLKKAKNSAEKEMQQAVSDEKLTWEEVFKNPYFLSLCLLVLLLGLLAI
jgi:predicted nuclease of restriction endonuclease-like (RecB) superfamily